MEQVSSKDTSMAGLEPLVSSEPAEQVPLKDTNLAGSEPLDCGFP